MIAAVPTTRLTMLPAEPREHPRARRILLLLAGLWLMNAFDLTFTLHAHACGLLVEANPVAHAILPMGPGVLILFKAVLVGFSSWVLLRYRRQILVECVAWLATSAYVIVSFRWMHCYEIYTAIVAARHFNAPEQTRVLSLLAG